MKPSSKSKTEFSAGSPKEDVGINGKLPTGYLYSARREPRNDPTNERGTEIANQSPIRNRRVKKFTFAVLPENHRVMLIKKKIPNTIPGNTNKEPKYTSLLYSPRNPTYILALTYPATEVVSTQKSMSPLNKPPLQAGEKKPSTAKPSVKTTIMTSCAP